MNRRIPILWLIPTLLLGMDLGWRLASPLGLSILAQQPHFMASGGPVLNSEAVNPDNLSAAYEKFHPVNHAFQSVSRALAPSVVHIVARKASEQEGDVEESGSGVVVATSHVGQYIMTNNHVVQDALPERIRIHLSDGRVLSPQRVWTDAKADVAVMKLAADAPRLVPATLGNSDEVVVGTWVMAMGSPFGLMHSVSQGIISARGRHEAELFQDGVENQDFFQTDAAINPGNSGGPLVNLKGEVVGINTAIASQGGGSEGVGFSIPINLAKWIMDQLLTHGKVHRGALGIDLDEMTSNRARQLGLDHPRGAVITGVHPDSPALIAGLKNLDVILRFNNTEIEDLNHLINVVSMAPIGDIADLLIWRNRSPLQIKVRVGHREKVLASPADANVMKSPDRSKSKDLRNDPLESGELIQGPWGITVREHPLPNEAGPDQAVSQQGWVVFSVEKDSPLASELEAGDRITGLNGKSFSSARSLMAEMMKAIASIPKNIDRKGTRSIELEIQRERAGSGSQTFILRVDL